MYINQDFEKSVNHYSWSTYVAGGGAEFWWVELVLQTPRREQVHHRPPTGEMFPVSTGVFGVWGVLSTLALVVVYCLLSSRLGFLPDLLFAFYCQVSILSGCLEPALLQSVLHHFMLCLLSTATQSAALPYPDTAEYSSELLSVSSLSLSYFSHSSSAARCPAGLSSTLAKSQSN